MGLFLHIVQVYLYNIVVFTAAGSIALINLRCELNEHLLPIALFVSLTRKILLSVLLRGLSLHT